MGLDAPATDGDQGLQLLEPALSGPLALYRGAVTSRVYPWSPTVSLPSIRGGSWLCHRSSFWGYYAGRAACVATCRDANQLPVDTGLESVPGNSDGGSDASWQQVASIVRLWYGHWVGHPGLRQSPRLMQEARLAKAPAVDPLVAWGVGEGGEAEGGEAEGGVESWPRYAVNGDSAGMRTAMQCSDDHVPWFAFASGFESRWS